MAAPEGNGNASEQPLTLQLTKESQLMISKLRQLKLDDPSAPGMTVFGETGNQIAILHGKISVPEAGQEQIATKEKYLVISPKGFFLAEGRSDVSITDDGLDLTLKGIRERGNASTNVSIDERGRLLTIGHNGGSQKFNTSKINSNPEQFAEILKSAIENSRKVAQQPLLEEIARAKAGNGALDSMIQQETASLQPPPNPGPAV